MMTITRLLLPTVLAASFLLSPAFGTPSEAPKASKAVATAAPRNAPSAQAIADAKSKGLVWVNLNSKVYHKDGRYYGTTKNGKFMTEADARKAGYKSAQAGGAAKKKAVVTPSKK